MTNTSIIIIAAAIVGVVGCIYGWVTGNKEALTTGNLIMGGLLTYAGIKLQPIAQRAMCKLGFHKYDKELDGIWELKHCQRCPVVKKVRIV